MKKPELIKSCAFCNDQFVASRPTATYCSNSCRTKANNRRRLDEQVKADLEAKQKQDEELLSQIAFAKQLKREQKAELKRLEQEMQYEIGLQAQEAKRIQDEQDAAELAEKKRKDEENRQEMKEKQDADEKIRLQNKERLRKILKERNDKKHQNKRNLMIGKGLLFFGVGAFAYYALTKPKEESPQTLQPHKPDEFSITEHPKLPLKGSSQTDNDAERTIDGNENTK